MGSAAYVITTYSLPVHSPYGTSKGRRVPRRAAAIRRRRPRIWVGNRSGSRRRPQLSSPWVDLGRRRPRRGSSTARGGVRGDGNGGRSSAARFRPGNDSSRHGMERSGVGARLRSSWCDESRRGGEPWPARRTAATRARALRSSSGKG